MNKFATPLILVAVGNVAVGCTSSFGKSSSEELPNILILMADQFRYSALGFLGTEPVMTPNLDRFISQGVYCSEATSPHPLSSPGRAVFMTGQYPLHNGVTGNCTSKTEPYGVQLREDAACWSDILSSHGYSLGYIGKWHLDSPVEPHVNTSNNTDKIAWNEWCPPHRRHAFSYWLSYGTYDKHLRPVYWDTDAARDEFFYVDQWGPEYEAQKAIDYIDNVGGVRKAGTPVALVVSMNPPHSEYPHCPQKYKDLYADLDIEALADRFGTIKGPESSTGQYYRQNIKNYYACITGVDEQMGLILKHLDSCGLANNTIVVLLSDHGNCLGLNDQPGPKNNYYDPSFRIPLAIRYPGRLTPSVNPLPIDLSDVYPTIFGLMGKAEWIDSGADGEDLSKSLRKGKVATSRRPYLDYQVGHPENSAWGRRGFRNKRYTFVLQLKDNEITEVHCFDRKKDPKEMNDIGENLSKGMRRRMMKELQKELRRFSDPFAEQTIFKRSKQYLKTNSNEKKLMYPGNNPV